MSLRSGSNLKSLMTAFRPEQVWVTDITIVAKAFTCAVQRSISIFAGAHNILEKAFQFGIVFHRAP